MMNKIILKLAIVIFLPCVGINWAHATEDAKAQVDSSTETQNIMMTDKAKIAKTTPESEIPLKIETLAKGTDTQSQSGKLVLTLAVLVGMLAAGYFFIRRFAYSNKINKSNLQIKILTQHHLGPKKTLAVVRVAGESILIGVTDQNISMIKSLSLIDDEIPVELGPDNFEAALNGERRQTADVENLAQEIEDDFSFSGIRTTVAQKLKSMRNIQ